MRPTENMENRIKNANIVINGETDKKIFNHILQSFKKSKAYESATAPPNMWRIIMKSKITKYAAVAVIIIGVIVGNNYFRGSIDGHGVVWGEVVKKVENVYSYKFRVKQSKIMESNNGKVHFAAITDTINYFSSEYGIKTESYRNGELSTKTYCLLQGREFIGMCPPLKEYSLRPLTDADISKMFQTMDPKRMVRQMLSGIYVEIGSDKINGIEVIGIETHDASLFEGLPRKDFWGRLWVDVNTNYPVKIEMEYGIDNASKQKMLTIVDDFQWDANLQAVDFVPNIPSDFILEKQDSQPQRAPHTPMAEYEREELDLSYLEELGLVRDENEPEGENISMVGGHVDIWKAQDDYMRTWPRYEEIQKKLYHELNEKLDLDNISQEELAEIAILLREKFWQAGGSFSKTSYQYGYMARVLMELAQSRDPENLVLTDELVETIMTTELVWNYQENSEEKIKNIAMRSKLMELRSVQFKQIIREIELGRIPAWEDFVRSHDLVILFASAGDYEAAREVVEWQIREAQRGGWTAYLEPIKRSFRMLKEGDYLSYNIYNAIKPDYPEDYRYGRRLFSFKGPRKRVVIPVHVWDSNSVWHGDK